MLQLQRLGSGGVRSLTDPFESGRDYISPHFLSLFLWPSVYPSSIYVSVFVSGFIFSFTKLEFPQSTVQEFPDFVRPSGLYTEDWTRTSLALLWRRPLAGSGRLASGQCCSIDVADRRDRTQDVRLRQTETKQNKRRAITTIYMRISYRIAALVRRCLLGLAPAQGRSQDFVSGVFTSP